MYTPTVVPDSLARELLTMLCDTVIQLSAAPQTAIPASPFANPLVPLCASTASPPESIVDGVRTPGSNSDSASERPFSPAPFTAFSPPLLARQVASTSSVSSHTDYSTVLPGEKQLTRVKSTLEAAWSNILANDSRKGSETATIAPTSSFFQMGGDHDLGYHSGARPAGDRLPGLPETIVWNPTFEGQMLMLAAMEVIA